MVRFRYVEWLILLRAMLRRGWLVLMGEWRMLLRWMSGLERHSRKKEIALTGIALTGITQTGIMFYDKADKDWTWYCIIPAKCYLTPFLHCVTKICCLVIKRVLYPSTLLINSEFMFPALHP